MLMHVYRFDLRFHKMTLQKYLSTNSIHGLQYINSCVHYHLAICLMTGLACSCVLYALLVEKKLIKLLEKTC